MSDSVNRFSNRVADYVKYRPDYPREIIPFLNETCGLITDSMIADVGCGPGISSKIFLDNGNRVIGVEPNAAMRDAAREYLAGYDNFSIVEGRSDATTLEDASVDFIIAAQAFHWFEPEATRAEFKRILKPGGHIVLMWNERQLDSNEFHREYEALLVRWSTDYQTVRHENIQAGELSNFFQDEYGSHVFGNNKLYDFDILKGRMSSSSYIPATDDPVYPQMVDELRQIFAKHAVADRIEVRYDTSVYYSLT
ncbi:MAG: class I SAM-dependent methyltransferase [Acidobacteria bacterium]|nr:class I SAM-dependent methyltransferase [Acidobacteriota bacterium]